MHRLSVDLRVRRYFTDSANAITLLSAFTVDGLVSFRVRDFDLAVNVVNLTNNRRHTCRISTRRISSIQDSRSMHT
jgi:hypothetical protein